MPLQIFFISLHLMRFNRGKQPQKDLKKMPINSIIEHDWEIIWAEVKSKERLVSFN
jgi:hypothetical protein